MNLIRPQNIKCLNLFTNLVFKNRTLPSPRTNLISTLTDLKNAQTSAKTQIRFITYRTPTNASKSKVFKPTTITVTKGNEFLKVDLQDENGIDLGKFKLLDAKKLADRKELKLVMIDEKPIFKLMSGQDLLKLQLKTRDDKKLEEKVHKLKEVDLNLGIDDHDLETKVNHVKGFYEKGHPIKIVIKSRIMNKNVIFFFLVFFIIKNNF